MTTFSLGLSITQRSFPSFRLLVIVLSSNYHWVFTQELRSVVSRQRHKARPRASKKKLLPLSIIMIHPCCDNVFVAVIAFVALFPFLPTTNAQSRPAPLPTPTVNEQVPTPAIPRSNVLAPTAPAAGPYRIQLQLVGVLSSDTVLFTNAKTKWESVISGDLANQTTNGLASVGSGCKFPSVIDDLYICASYRDMDGVQNVVGIAGPSYNRAGTNIAYVGTMEFDIADIPGLKAAGSLTSTVTHEMGHVIGIGTNWDDKGLISASNSQCPYTGKNANREYKTVSGCQVVPLEKEAAKGPCSHWDEECLVDELMTGVLVTKSKPIMSRITLGTLADLGYTVNYAKADKYTKSNLGPGCTCNRRNNERSMLNMSNGETLQFGLRGGSTSPEAGGGGRRHRRRLSDETHQMAMEYGRKVLAQRTLSPTDRKLLNSDVVYVGDQVVSVLVQEDDELYGVIVRREN